MKIEEIMALLENGTLNTTNGTTAPTAIIHKTIDEGVILALAFVSITFGVVFVIFALFHWMRMPKPTENRPYV